MHTATNQYQLWFQLFTHYSGLVSVHHTFVCAIEIFLSYKNNYNKFFSIWRADKLNVSSYNFSIADIDRQTLEFYWSLRHSR